MFWTVLRIVVALGAAVVLYLVGAAFVRYFATGEAPPDEPDFDALEDVDFRYQCIVCGAQLVLFAAPGGDVPEAPRHCREPMTLVAPVD